MASSRGSLYHRRECSPSTAAAAQLADPDGPDEAPGWGLVVVDIDAPRPPAPPPKPLDHAALLAQLHALERARVP